MDTRDELISSSHSAGSKNVSDLDQVIQLHEICMNLVCFRSLLFCQFECKNTFKFVKQNGEKVRQNETEKV